MLRVSRGVSCADACGCGGLVAAGAGVHVPVVGPRGVVGDRGHHLPPHPTHRHTSHIIITH